MKKNILLTLVMVLAMSGMSYGVLSGNSIPMLSGEFLDDGDGSYVYTKSNGTVYHPEKAYDGTTGGTIMRIVNGGGTMKAPTIQYNADMTQPGTDRIMRNIKTVMTSNWDGGRAWDDAIFDVKTPSGWAPFGGYYNGDGGSMHVPGSGHAWTVEALRCTEFNFEPVDDASANNRNDVKSQVEVAEWEIDNIQAHHTTFVIDLMPDAPTNLSLSGNTLSWDAVAGASGYNVWASVTGQSGLDYAPLNFFLNDVSSVDINLAPVGTNSYDLSAAIAAGFDVTYLAVTTVDEMTQGTNTATVNSVYSAEIPEPATLLLLLGGTAFLRRRK